MVVVLQNLFNSTSRRLKLLAEGHRMLKWHVEPTLQLKCLKLRFLLFRTFFSGGFNGLQIFNRLDRERDG